MSTRATIPPDPWIGARSARIEDPRRSLVRSAPIKPIPPLADRGGSGGGSLARATHAARALSGDDTAPGVAHFRPVWYQATETFLYNYVRSARRTRPLLVGYERARADEFPHAGPVLSLYPPGSAAALGRRARLRFGRAFGGEDWGADWDPGFPPLRVAPWLRRHGARLLHAHFGDIGVSLLPLRRRSGLPLVTSFYGYDAGRLARLPAWRERFRTLFAEGDAFLVEGPALGESLRELGCPAEKLHIQRIAIDLACYAFRSRVPPADGRPVGLFFCARFTEKKGLLHALEALARVRDRHPNVAFRVAGDGPLRGEVEAAIDRLRLGGVVELLGMLSHERMREELDRCDVFVQPSVMAKDGDSEGGAPTTLLEAQACGAAILTTDHADIPAVVDPGRSALVSPEGDIEALAANLASLLAAPERWAALGRAGRDWVERHHAIESEGERLEKLYLDRIDARAHAS
jgi:colanic acid/amylovoran biosynthesis glycosyltransferase